MNNDDEVEIFPAQKTLQMKAGTGNISAEKLGSAAVIDEAQTLIFNQEIGELLESYKSYLKELEKTFESEQFVAGPETQAIVQDIIETLMNIKASIIYTNAKELSELTAFILLTIDNLKKMDTRVKKELDNFAILLENTYKKQEASFDKRLVEEYTAIWTEISRRI